MAAISLCTLPQAEALVAPRLTDDGICLVILPFCRFVTDVVRCFLQAEALLPQRLAAEGAVLLPGPLCWAQSADSSRRVQPASGHRADRRRLVRTLLETTAAGMLNDADCWALSYSAQLCQGFFRLYGICAGYCNSNDSCVSSNRLVFFKRTGILQEASDRCGTFTMLGFLLPVVFPCLCAAYLPKHVTDTALHCTA